MKQIISKDGVIKCITAEPYPKEIIRQMKKTRYKIREEEN